MWSTPLPAILPVVDILAVGPPRALLSFVASFRTPSAETQIVDLARHHAEKAGWFVQLIGIRILAMLPQDGLRLVDPQTQACCEMIAAPDPWLKLLDVLFFHWFSVQYFKDPTYGIFVQNLGVLWISNIAFSTKFPLYLLDHLILPCRLLWSNDQWWYSPFLMVLYYWIEGTTKTWACNTSLVLLRENMFFHNCRNIVNAICCVER